MRVNKLVKILNWLPGLRVLTIICILYPFMNFEGLASNRKDRRVWTNIKYISLFSTALETFLLFDKWLYLNLNINFLKCFFFFSKNRFLEFIRAHWCLQFEFNPTKQLLKQIFFKLSFQVLFYIVFVIS